MNNKFFTLDLRNHTGRIFVVGDIHGCFSKLDEELAKLGFSDEDILLSVGDLVDRGSESHLAVDFLERPNVYAVRGNHEQMCLDAGGTSWHEGNGGRWWKKLKYSHNKRPQDDFIKSFRNLPIIMEVLLPSGKKIGLVHAEYPSTCWSRAADMADRFEEACMWSRTRITDINRNNPCVEVIDNVDHVYYGHTPLPNSITVGNQTYLDTGAVFSDGHFTIMEVK